MKLKFYLKVKETNVTLNINTKYQPTKFYQWNLSLQNKYETWHSLKLIWYKVLLSLGKWPYLHIKNGLMNTISF